MVKMDKFGKMFFPKDIREKISDDEFEVFITDEKIELIPVKKPLDLFGTLKGIDKKHLDEHHGEDHDIAS